MAFHRGVNRHKTITARKIDKKNMILVDTLELSDKDMVKSYEVDYRGTTYMLHIHYVKKFKWWFETKWLKERTLSFDAQKYIDSKYKLYASKILSNVVWNGLFDEYDRRLDDKFRWGK